MPDWSQLPQTPLFVHSWSRWGMGLATPQSLGYSSSITWPVASTAFYIPFFLPWPYPVARVYWANGSSVSGVNVDVGIYTADGVQIYHTGSTARAGATAIQYVTPTSFLLSPGMYYFGYSCDSVVANNGGQGATTASLVQIALSGVLQQASALPLPATMTPVTVANACQPFCGITRTTSGF